MAVQLSLFIQIVMLTMFPFYKKRQKGIVQFHVRQGEHFHVNSFLYSISIQPTSLHRRQQNVRLCKFELQLANYNGRATVLVYKL